MLALTRKIIVESGIITEILHSDNLELIIDGHSYKFPPGATAVVGFVDCHGHIAGYGMRLSEVSLKDCKSIHDCIAKLHNTKLFRGNWITAFGWNHENWAENSLPTKELLDEAFPDTPVYLTRQDGHSALVNSAALKIAYINELTTNPQGGEIVRSYDGKPTGMLIDNAMALVEKHIPDYSLEQYTEFIKTALSELARYGITQAHDMDVETRFVPIFNELELAGEMPVRVKSFVRAQNNELLRDCVLPYKGNFFKVQGLKYFLDGALGSYGAALTRGYDDNETKSGFLLLDENTLMNRAKRGILSGFDIAIHAIGDSAVNTALNAVEKLRSDSLLEGSGTIRIEHAQMVLPNDLPRFAKLNVVASVQPYHFTSDTNGMAQKRIGSRMRFSYLWESFIQQGATIIAGSDFPIEKPSVIDGIRSFLTRQSSLDGTIISPNERLSIFEALDAYCVAPHRVHNESAHFGCIEAGKTADITVLSANPYLLQNEPEMQIDVLATIVGGKVAFLNS
ncbi:MAG: amidohydrolase [Bacteroidota bacterium]